MSETKAEVVIDERPVFKVTQAGGFATGLKKYEPGELVVWEVPPGWNDKRYGKHFAHYGPSVTFEPMNLPAVDLMAKHKKLLEEKNRPKQTEEAVRAAKMEELLTKQLEIQAKSAEAQLALNERLTALLERLSKK
jgi:heme exporter protein D